MILITREDTKLKHLINTVAKRLISAENAEDWGAIYTAVASRNYLKIYDRLNKKPHSFCHSVNLFYPQLILQKI